MALSPEARSDLDRTVPEAACFGEILVREVLDGGEPKAQGGTMEGAGGLGGLFLEAGDLTAGPARVLASGPSEPGQGGGLYEVLLVGGTGGKPKGSPGEGYPCHHVKRGVDHIVQPAVEVGAGGSVSEGASSQSPGRSGSRAVVHNAEGFSEGRDFSDDGRFVSEGGSPHQGMVGWLAESRMCVHAKVIHRVRHWINAGRLCFLGLRLTRTEAAGYGAAD